MTQGEPSLTITTSTTPQSQRVHASSVGSISRPLVSLLTMESETAQPSLDRLRNVAIQIDKVLCTTVDVKNPARDVKVDKLALGRVLELGELG